MRLCRAIACIATPAVLGLAGCAVDQARDVATYREVTDIPDQPVSHRPGEPLPLVKALLLANALNERLGIQGEAYVQALVERQRLAASILPTIDAFGSVTGRDATASGTDRVATEAGIGAQYTLLTGRSDFHAIDAAKMDANAERWLLLDLREALMLETAGAYYAVMSAERQVSVLASAVSVQDERLREATIRQGAGLARPLDVAQIDAQRAETRVQLLDAQSLAVQTRSLLVLLTAADVGSAPLTDEFDPAHDARPLDHFLGWANADRLDLRAAAETARAERKRVDEAIGRYYPTVALNLDWFLYRDSAPANLDLLALLSINVPIFSAGRLTADVRDAWSVFRESVLRYHLTRREIRADVERAHDRFTASGARATELEAQVRAAQSTLRQAEAAYSAGLGTNLERVTAQDQLLAADLRASTEQFERKIAYIQLLRACGALSADLAGSPKPPPDETASLPESPFLVRPVTPAE